MKKPVPEEMFSRIEKLFKADMTAKEISEILGISKITINRIRQTGFNKEAYTEYNRNVGHKKPKDSALDERIFTKEDIIPIQPDMSEALLNIATILSNIHETLIDIKDNIQKPIAIDNRIRRGFFNK